MGAMKESPRYSVVTTRLSDREAEELERFAKNNQTSICDAARRMILAGLEAMEPN